MTTFGGIPTHPLTRLALTLGDAVDAGWDLPDLQRECLTRYPMSANVQDVVTDALVAAHAVLCGLDPHWTELTQAWSASTPEAVVRVVEALVRQVIAAP